jgi:REP element-mobilizing transposase RayT
MAPEDFEPPVSGITPAGRPRASTPPPWLQDVDRAAQHLARLSLETDAQAALITRGPRIWAYAGELPHPALGELADAVAGSLEDVEDGDLARFIRLEETDAEYMLYSTNLVDDLVLSLAFDAAIRFSEIRSQAFRLARGLATISNGEPSKLEASSPGISGFANHANVSQVSSNLQPDTAGFKLTGPSLVGSQESSEGETLDETGIEGDSLKDEISPDLSQPVPDALFLDPVSPAIHNLTFACVLIPRLPLHRLMGDLKEQLEGWLPQVCLAFGWRLNDISVRPDRLQWVVNLPPNYSPAFMLDRVRKLTSERIFESHPAIRAENLSDDFWAPGFMILASSRLPVDEAVAKYIRRTRTWQGYRK